MLICLEWLAEYVDLSETNADELALKFAMSGLNHESTEQVGSDTVIDLEVTSNRGDCLGHIGVAREAAVLLGKPLKMPSASPKTVADSVEPVLTIENEFLEGCPEYTGRVIRNVKIGPSPNWLIRRLAAVGIKSVNNVVDVTNYVMLECGQPLHAFDLSRIHGGKIRIRAAADGEKFLAIDHKTYELDAAMVVIADQQRAVALGGVMGGAESEVSESTTDLLIESARFSSLAIRRAARKLKLHSPSSFRFERTPDALGLDWASRRCCELILQVAGGELLLGVASGGQAAKAPVAVPFRLTQIARILGIQVPAAEVKRILNSLGCDVQSSSGELLQVTPPSWRNDLTREIDFVEEVARIYGYDRIPENVKVPLGVAQPRPKDIALNRARQVLSAYGVDEAMTPSVVGESLEAVDSFWTSRPPLATDTALLVGAKLLRRSMVPSLLAARYANQTQSIANAQLYEVATIFLPGEASTDLPHEQSTLGIVTQGDLRYLKGAVEELLDSVCGTHCSLTWSRCEHPMLQPGTGLNVQHEGRFLAFLGILASDKQKAIGLDAAAGVAEVSVDLLSSLLNAVRTADQVSLFPSVERDLNFIVDETLTWAELSAVCLASGGENLQRVEFSEIYRDPNKDGESKKRTLLRLHFQSLHRTLTGEEVELAKSNIIDACRQQFSAKLLG